MANVWATKNGNWSDTTVWNTGVLPTASDAVWASGSTVLINQDINVISLNNFVSGTIGAGGTFNLYSSRTITASINSGTVNTLTITGSGLTVNILGNINGSTTTNINTVNISALSGSTLNINGNLVGGTVTSNAVLINSTGSIYNITGSVISNTGVALAVQAANANTFNISGSIISTLGTTGISFRIIGPASSNTYNIIGNIIANGGNTIDVNITTSSFFNITGSISMNTLTNGVYGINIISLSSTYNISGSITGQLGSATSCLGIYAQGTSNIVNVIGDLTGGSNNAAISLGGTNNDLRVTGNLSSGIAGYGLSVFTSAPYTASIIGDLLVPNSGNALIINTSTGVGTITITGSVYAGPGGTSAINTITSPTNYTVNILGNVYAGTSTNAYGIVMNNASTNSTITVRGNVYSTANTSYGAYNASTAGVIVISGSVFAANAIGAYNNSTGQILINGSAIAGAFVGAHNASTGILKVISAVASTSSAAINGVNASGTTTFENATFASNGQVPWLGYAKMVSSSVNFLSSSLEGNRYKILIDNNNIAQGLPAISDVRLGTIYNSGANTGTLAIPSASQVLLGIAVDNTTGSASLTTGSIASSVWDTLTTTLITTGSVGERLKNAATVASVGDQLVALI